MRSKPSFSASAAVSTAALSRFVETEFKGSLKKKNGKEKNSTSSCSCAEMQWVFGNKTKQGTGKLAAGAEAILGFALMLRNFCRTRLLCGSRDPSWGGCFDRCLAEGFSPTGQNGFCSLPSPLDAALTEVSCRTRTSPACVTEGLSRG